MKTHLFSEGTINGVTLKNRIVRSATWEGMCDEEGRPSERLIDLYRALCQGGVGLIVTGYTYVRSDGRQLPGKMGIDSDDQIPALRNLTQAVHDAGGRIFCQLVHAGGQASAKAIGGRPLAPSEVKDATSPDLPRAMDQQDIREIVAAFAAGAGRAKLAGFDGVQLHGAHGYLINQFLSPLTNLRQDSYGGSLENRMRFLQDVYAAVRQEIGPSFPVTIKLTAADNIEGGITLEEAVTVARSLDEWGIDAIEVSSGTAASGEEGPIRRQIDSPGREAYNARYAKRIKEQVGVPVIAVGGFRSKAVSEIALEKGDADFIALSRPFIREPDLVRKWQEDSSQRAHCISCNGCFRPGIKEGGVRCVLV
ncbi:2,4-dienoyl-CoA reductase-like NADH-dependent reductase (Old Yellow Enzyme family) [Geothermobacter ehrlichii]|uniref:2,4-dienoyl-CoA reductase-like NADH-dependent reductase (Old Yellow Enzyme family) n=1 Tax=Geothermobacter ehrlichii TaxID=213224 RepID=A0A5D3WGR2_9BACT|nr:NADH:flavin oxidoreductase [Geothermobacter ehrlichii]TYO95032.1 2,4-dienoyl-CoA reductase-like NADH-dependent reductase (Old Yellow Enzyme family) [Geothermobacter ehrlichii]